MSQFTHNSYSMLTMSREQVKRHLPNFVRDIQWYLQAQKAQALAVTGTSGLSIAMVLTHLAPAVTVPILYVRKPGEDSHGHEVEIVAGRGKTLDRIERVLFVDDLVCTGSTRDRVALVLAKYGCEVVGTVTHEGMV